MIECMRRSPTDLRNLIHQKHKSAVASNKQPSCTRYSGSRSAPSSAAMRSSSFCADAAAAAAHAQGTVTPRGSETLSPTHSERGPSSVVYGGWGRWLGQGAVTREAAREKGRHLLTRAMASCSSASRFHLSHSALSLSACHHRAAQHEMHAHSTAAPAVHCRYWCRRAEHRRSMV